MHKKKVLLRGVISYCVLAILFGCGSEPKQASLPADPSSFSIHGSVRELYIGQEKPQFPAGEGKNEFISYCNICHSLKYITAQPDFPRKTWDAEVHKMVAKYGAPIDSATSVKIVNYLVAIKSKH